MKWADTLRSLDWVLFSASILLSLIGLTMLVSAGAGQASLSGLVVRQLAALAVSLVVFMLFVRVPYHAWQRWAWLIYGLGLTGLLIVTLVGHVIRGSVSRLEFFGWQLQPSEFMKVALVLILARLLSSYRNIRFSAAWMSIVVVAVPLGLVLVEPDAGMAGLLLVAWAGMLLFAGLPWRHIGALAVCGSVLMAVAWHSLLLPYQKERIITFLNPQADPLASGYNVTQSVIAFGSGQVLGRGLGHGPQSQLNFLPERHTDFVLASLGEELGFVGVMLVVGLYAILLWRIIVIARTTRDRFGQLLAVGVFFVLLAGFTVSAGMNIGLLPVTGIPLPLLSYGGSNLLVTFFLLSLVQSIHVYSRFMRTSPPEMSGIV